MKALLYLAILVLLYFAFTKGLRWCYEGTLWMVPPGCHQFRLEVIDH